MMVKRTAYCQLCDYQVTKNGYWKTRIAITNHLKKEHPKEFAEMIEHNKKLMDKIAKLKRDFKFLLSMG